VSFARQIRDVWEVPRDLALGRYPDFVRGGPLPRGQVPVFVFHSLEAETFGAQLEHLARNGYATLGADEYLHVLLGARPAPERAVVLTFDDGRGSLWSVGAPLLQKHGMRGVVFLVPARVPSRPGPPRAQDLRSQEAEVPFLSWQEVDALARASVFEFQSHSLTHGRVHVRPALAGFVTPAARHGYAGMDVPLVFDGRRDLMGEDVPLGTPVLRAAPRLADDLRFYEDPAWGRPAVEHVAAHGGAAFFRDPRWRARLRAVLPRTPPPGRVETVEERVAAIRRELVESRRLIEERTRRPVEHLCFPWHVSSFTARQLAREAGYRAVFQGKVPGTPITAVGGDTQHVARVGEDYVELLPGKGRTTLARVLLRKWRRRLALSRGVTSPP
jgi:peptidoglycan/xylan/chitin deacetylase (PgdA/CDA1 family)